MRSRTLSLSLSLSLHTYIYIYIYIYICMHIYIYIYTHMWAEAEADLPPRRRGRAVLVAHRRRVGDVRQVALHARHLANLVLFQRLSFILLLSALAAQA